MKKVTLNRMGIGGWVYECPTVRSLKIVQGRLPKEGTEIVCSCGETHIVEHGNTSHFSKRL